MNLVVCSNSHPTFLRQNAIICGCCHLAGHTCGLAISSVEKTKILEDDTAKDKQYLSTVEKKFIFSKFNGTKNILFIFPSSFRNLNIERGLASTLLFRYIM